MKNYTPKLEENEEIIRIIESLKEAEGSKMIVETSFISYQKKGGEKSIT